MSSIEKGEQMSNPQEDEISAEPLLRDSLVVGSPAGDDTAKSMFRSRKTAPQGGPTSKKRRRKNRTSSSITSSSWRPWSRNRGKISLLATIWQWLNRSPSVPAGATPTLPQHQPSLRCMNVIARGVLWGTILSLSIAVIWYSYELFNHGTDPHSIAWFSAGAFVLLGFPISMWGIVSHLANYNQPHVQVYIVRILAMVPMYSVESWLAMRFHKYAIYIETLRDFYESFVLYSFFQFLIQVLGGEQALVLMLKDKSPTRGVHMWGLQWCVKPWLMGQPVRQEATAAWSNESEISSGGGALASETSNSSKDPLQQPGKARQPRLVKRVLWTSPFFVKCKFGVLQYVLLKFVSAIAIMLLERIGWYKEGDFTPQGGYLYICFITNLSQCWALYCLVLFYYATHIELGPIQPVGKFLSVKALVFFTWWQSVVIAYLLWMNMIPNYSMTHGSSEGLDGEDWTPEDVAKGVQDYLICVEMFFAAIIHSCVFPASEYSPQAVEARTRALHHAPVLWKHKKRLGRSKSNSYFYGAASNFLYGRTFDDSTSKASMGTDVELSSLNSSEKENPMSSAWSDHGLQNFTKVSPQTSPVKYPGSIGSLERDDVVDEAELELPTRIDTETVMAYLRPPTFGEPDTEDGSLSSRKTPLRLDTVLDVTEEGDGESDDTGDDEATDEDDDDGGNLMESLTGSVSTAGSRPGFVRALLDSAIPRDMVENTVGIIKGDYNVERKTLLHHAATSDQYDLFSNSRGRRQFKKGEQ